MHAQDIATASKLAGVGQSQTRRRASFKRGDTREKAPAQGLDLKAWHWVSNLGTSPEIGAEYRAFKADQLRLVRR